jgi:ABC-type Fe3+-hydroxamate transport system substrate-binding protein
MGIQNILDQSKITTLKVAVDAEKLSKAKPDSILTLKFNLSAKDFAMISESESPSNF